MSPDVWGPLLGVVVGAVLGGGAQIVDSHLSARRAKRSALHEVRRSAYVELLRACTQLSNDTYMVLNFDSTVGRGIPDVAVGMTAVHAARAELSLVAPEDTLRAGSLYVDLVMALGQAAREKTESSHQTKMGVARDMFVTYAQRDLGYGPGFRRETIRERWQRRRNSGHSPSNGGAG